MDPWSRASRAERRLFLLIEQIFSNHPQLLEFFFDKSQPRIRFEPLDMIKEAGCFSSGEQVLIRVALDMWSCSGNAKVWQLLETLDHENFSNVLKALDNWRHYRSAN